MTGTDEIILDLLVSKGLISQEQGDNARQNADENGISFTEALTELGYMSEEQVMMVLAGEYGMETFDLSEYDIPSDVLKEVPGDIARQYQVIPVMKSNGTIVVAMANPAELETLDSLRYILKTDVEGVIAPKHQIEDAITEHYGTNEERVESFLEDVTEGNVEIVGGAQGIEEQAENSEDTADDAPIIRLVSLAILEAFKKNASDIHFEPMEKRFRLRYRIDGVLHEVDNPPRYLQNNILSRAKIMAGMNIAEHRVPQDGRIEITAMGKDLDLRVSDIPTTHGESLVMRILDKSSIMVGIPELGFMSDDQEMIERIIGYPDGLFLVTGPTGSGKTTSLYAFLNVLNQPTRKIITVENPVEYELPGINQVQVNEAAEMTFANALRAMLRQAPNIVMVGEIRDSETGEIAINAALTGHLVFSTLHTNDAPSAVTRLIDMGVKPFLVASSVRAIMAQRLVRKVCPNCVEDVDPDPTDLEALRLPKDYFEGQKLKKGRGCADCSQGYKGRVGIFEIFEVDATVQEMVYERVTVSKVREHARSVGMRTLREDGLRKVLAGITTLEEVARVTAADEYQVAQG